MGAPEDKATADSRDLHDDLVKVIDSYRQISVHTITGVLAAISFEILFILNSKDEP